MRRLGWVAIVLLVSVVAAPEAHADKRIALLIGNHSYKPGVGALVNPLNDIRVVGEAFEIELVINLKTAKALEAHDSAETILLIAERLTE
jgi:hypothetical protein